MNLRAVLTAGDVRHEGRVFTLPSATMDMSAFTRRQRGKTERVVRIRGVGEVLAVDLRDIPGDATITVEVVEDEHDRTT